MYYDSALTSLLLYPRMFGKHSPTSVLFVMLWPRALLRTQDTYSTPFLFLCPWIFIITSTIQFTSFALLPCVYKLRSTSPPWPSCVSMVPEPFPVFISRRAIKTPYTLHTHGSWLVAVIDYLLRMLYPLRYAIPNSTSHETTSYNTRSVHCMHT